VQRDGISSRHHARSGEDMIGLPPTLESVAAISGVSRATVSRVINGSDRVTEEARRAVHDAIARVGYVPHRAARSVTTRRTDSVALVVREPVQFGMADPYLAVLVTTASQALVGAGLQPVVMMAADDADHVRLADQVRDSHLDGVLLIAVHDDDPLPEQLVRAGIPLALAGRPPAPLAGASYVDIDNAAGAALAAEHLLATGCRRLAVVAGPTDLSSSADRLAGFRAAVRAAGVRSPTVEHGGLTVETGRRAAGEILHRQPEVDAVFAASDPMALGTLRVLRRLGRRVPDDVAVIGFDDSAAAPLADPPLSSVHQSPEEMGVAMARLLVSRIRGEAVADPVVIMRPHLVLRESA